MEIAMPSGFSSYSIKPLTPTPAPRPSFSKLDYLLGLLIILAAICSQYIIPLHGLLIRFSVIYGIPILVATLLLGKFILKRAFKNNSKALDYGLAYWGLLSVISFLGQFFIFLLITNLSPETTHILERANPRLPSSAHLAWIMIFLSLFVIGPAEEYIFRGFIFGGLLKIFKGKFWFLWAFISSLLFAFVHFYYYQTFGLASSIIFMEIISIGLALSITYYVSGGNLLIPTILHGFYDAAGFLNIATFSNIGSYLRISLIIIGLVIAISLALRNIFSKSPPQQTMILSS